MIKGIILILPTAAVGALIGWAAAGMTGAALGGGSVVGGLLLVLLRIDEIAMRAHGPLVAPSATFLTASGAGPRVYIFSDPAPHVLVVRGWGRRGVILISQGLLQTATEGQLRDLLSFSIKKSRQASLPIRSLAAVILSVLSADHARKRLEGVSVSGFIRSLIFSPLIRLMVSISQDRSSAVVHIHRRVGEWVSRPHPAYLGLYLTDMGVE